MSARRVCVHALALALGALILPVGATEQIPGAEQIVQRIITAQSTNRMIVKLRPAANGVARPMSGARMNALMTRAGQPLRVLRSTGRDAHVLQLDASLRNSDATALARKLAEDPEVEYAQPDLRMHAFAVPNDPQFAAQWYLTDNIVGLNLQLVWNQFTTGQNVTPGIVVAVLDTGIVRHGDLPNDDRILDGYDFISEAVVAGDGDARDANAIDSGDRILTPAEQRELEEVFDASCDLQSSSWHGTRVASVIAASTNNGIGIAGVNWNARILPIRVLGRCGGFTSDILDAMRWAAGLQVAGLPLNGTPAQVLNLSLGVFDDSVALSNAPACGQAEQDTVNEILSSSGVKAIVVAAGNESKEARLSTPASCSGVISVGGVRRDGDRDPGSNYGRYVSLSAPYGVQPPLNSPCQSASSDTIISLSNAGTDGPLASPAGDELCENGGTSFSAPLVSGAISLILSVAPNLTASQVYDIVRGTARDFPTGSSCLTTNFSCGAGTLDALAAVQQAQNNPPAARAFPGPDDISGGGGCAVARGGADASLIIALLGASGYLWSRRRRALPARLRG